MSLRKKLIILHGAFAVFAVVTASATIYGVQLRLKNAITSFEQLIDQSSTVEQLRLASQRQTLRLRDIVESRSTVNAAYLADRDAFLTRLGETSQFGINRRGGGDWKEVASLTKRLREEYDRCLVFVQNSEFDEANRVFAESIESDLASALNSRLRTIQSSFESARNDSVNLLLSTNNQLLGLAALVAALCGVLVLAGSEVVHRWLIAPITKLHKATAEFAAGDLDYRVQVNSDDELGTLGTSLNEMAASLGRSESRYRSLFENLRDALFICDAEGTILEYHDSDTQVLGANPDEAVGRKILDVWPEWEDSSWDWQAVTTRVIGTGVSLREIDIEWPGRHEERTTVDIMGYPVEYHGSRYAAIVIRDATQRANLRRLGRRSETMEASVNFARGIAHDFKNYLNSAVTTLSLIGPSGNNGKDADRVKTAQLACQEAANFSPRLLSFATADEGTPEPLDLSETTSTILDSLDEPFLSNLEIQKSFDSSVFVRMDRDYLTRVVLNLIRNAKEAMPNGGKLNIETKYAVTSNPLENHPPANHGVLVVSDSGTGMTDEVKSRLFEPLFTTKPRTIEGPRGMGLAVVYAAVRNAGGFVQIVSEVNEGTAIHVYLPPGQGRPMPNHNPTVAES